MREEVPLNLIPDEYKVMPGRDVPFDMLPDELKPKKGLVGRTLDKTFPPLPYLFGQQEEPQGAPVEVPSVSELPTGMAVSHTPTTRTPYPTVGEGYDPFESAMKLAEIRRKASEEARGRIKAKKEQIKTGEPGLWTAPSPPLGKGFIPFMGTVEKRLTGEKEWLSPETFMEPGFEIAQMYLGGKVLGGVFNAIKGSTWFRMLGNKERGLIVQTAKDMVKARNAQIGEAEKDVLARLGKPPVAEDFTSIDKFGRARANYETNKSELMKDYKAVPSVGDIARTVEDYGKKLAEERMRGEVPKPTGFPPTLAPVSPTGKPVVVPPIPEPKAIDVTTRGIVSKVPPIPEVVRPVIKGKEVSLIETEFEAQFSDESLLELSKHENERISGPAKQAISVLKSGDTKRMQRFIDDLSSVAFKVPDNVSDYLYLIRGHIESKLKPEAKVEEVKEITVGLAKPRKPEKFSDITRWVIKQGGVKPDDPNIDPVGWSRKGGGPIGLVSKKAKYGLDELATLLPEGGFPGMTTDELAEVISNRVRGGKTLKGYTDAEIARLEDEWNQEHMDILNSDPQTEIRLLKPDTKKALTKSLDDEIMGLKEEWRERGISESGIESAIQKAYKIAQDQGIIEKPEAIRETFQKPAEELVPEIQQIQKEMGITEPELPLEERAGLLERAGFPEEAQRLRGAPSPTMKGETLLPGMKVGLEFPKEGKEVTPTLEGTPLMGAARKAEVERIQPGLPLPPGILPKLIEVGKGIVESKFPRIDEVTKNQRQEVLEERIKERQRGSLGLPFAKKPAIKTGIKEVDEMLGAKPSFLKEFEEKIEKGTERFKRTFIYEHEINEFPALVDNFRIFQGETHRSLKKSKEAIDGIVGNLKNKAEYDIFNKMVVLEDLAERAGKELPLPRGLTLDQVNQAKTSLESQITPNIRTSIDKHLEFVKAMRDDLIEKGKIHGGFENYYPHVVLDYLWNKERAIMAPKKGHLYKPGYAKEAHGSIREIETDYVTAMTKRISQYRYDIAKEDFITKVTEKYDRSDLIPEIKKIYNFSEDRRLKPGEVFEVEGKRYKTWQPEMGNQIYPATTLIEDAIAKSIQRGMTTEELGAEIAKSIEAGEIAQGLGAEGQPIKLTSEAMAIGRKKPLYLLPESIFWRLEKFSGVKQDTEIFRTLNNMTSKWKGLTIDFGGTAWNLMNLTGDLQNLFRVDPGSFTKLPLAAKEAIKETWFKGSDLGKLAQKWEVEAGYMKSEAPLSHKEFLRFRGDLQRIYGNTFGKLREFYRDVLNIRETTPRYANFFKNLERIEKGEPIKIMDFPPEVVKELSPVGLAAKSAREFTVDYGKFTPEENSMFRGLLAPFYSWTRQNTPNWFRYAVKHPVGLTIKFLIPWVAMEIWNNTEFPEVEKNLSKYQRAIPHIITGWKDKNGKQIVISLKGDPLRDAIEVIGLAEVPSRISDLITERITLSNAAKETIKDIALGIPKRAGQLLTPFLKAPAEAIGNISFLTGRRLYPESFRGTKEAWKEGAEHIVESIFRPIREHGTAVELGKKKEFDPLTYRYLLGLPLTKVDLEKEKLKRTEEKYYDLLRDVTGKGVDLLDKEEWFKKLPSQEQDRIKAFLIDRLQMKFQKKIPPPMPRKRKILKGLSEQEEREKTPIIPRATGGSVSPTAIKSSMGRILPFGIIGTKGILSGPDLQKRELEE